ncbi:hypothetical protein [Comamonas aquatica]|uniref:hypothetical protein n=1 Tax=Comamonas aquatica TaxID=225991 RepID=UPI0005A7B08F|nr:hypothetical protein [Comamonas aquatica]
MPNLCDAPVEAWRAHWKAHGSAFPSCIELTAADLQALNAERQLTHGTTNFKQADGWEDVFHGAKLQVGSTSCMVLASGEPVVLAGAVSTS